MSLTPPEVSMPSRRYGQLELWQENLVLVQVPSFLLPPWPSQGLLRQRRERNSPWASVATHGGSGFPTPLPQAGDEASSDRRLWWPFQGPRAGPRGLPCVFPVSWPSVGLFGSWSSMWLARLMQKGGFCVVREPHWSEQLGAYRWSRVSTVALVSRHVLL